MASSGVGGSKGAGESQNPNMEDLFRKLNLTEEEGAVMGFSDDEEEETLAPLEQALVGKILASSPVHISTVRSAMKAAWGNPIGLKLRSIRGKGDNLFVAEFGSARDVDRVMQGTPWMVGKYAVLLQEYNEKLTASKLVFDRMELWAQIVDLPLGWMNRARGSRAMGMLGHVLKMDVDDDGKASDAFLRARVAVEVDKPIRRGILLRINKNEDPRWFRVQYERLPYICFSCGKMDHSDLECLTPAERDENGKLSYDVQLRAPEERRRRQSFANAAAESIGSGTSTGSRPPRQHNRSGGRGSMLGSRHSNSFVDESDDPEVQSPLKPTGGADIFVAEGGSAASRRLDLQDDRDGVRLQPRKRKAKVNTQVAHTPDLNVPIGGSNALVPTSLVNSRVSQLDIGGENSGSSMIETLKKQKKGTNNNAGSAAAAQGSPRRAQ